MKKKITLCSILIIVLSFILILLIDKKYINESHAYEDYSNISFYVDDGDGYTETNSIPVGDYTIDESKSYCDGDGKFSDYDSESGTMKFIVSGHDECVVYFKALISLSETVIGLASDTEYTSSQDGTPYLVKQENATGVSTDVPYTKVTNYGTTTMYKASSATAVSGSSISRDPFVLSSDNVWTNQKTGSAGDYMHIVLPIQETGFYEICYTLGTGGTNNQLLAYITDSANTTGGQNAYLGGSSSIPASSSSTKSGCTYVGYLTTANAIRIVNRINSDYANVSFYLQKIVDQRTYDAGIRYEGNDPDNYVSFNGEEWRIIGTFEGSTIGLEPGKWYTKIIRNTLMNKVWDDNGENDWTNSTLNAYLNGEYLQGLTDKTKIAKYNGNYSTWHLRGMTSYQNAVSTTNDWYMAERVTGGAGYRDGVSGDADETTKSAIALMYPSDYGYAAYGQGCTRETTPLGSYGTIEDGDTMEVLGCAGVDWLLLEEDWEWLLSPRLDYSNVAFLVKGDDGGYVDNGSVKHENAVRPVLYLEHDVYITDGTGAKDDPYKLERPKTLSNAVIGLVSDNEYTSSQDGTSYVVKRETVEYNSTTYDAGVRYEGNDPDNYIEFNNGEEWRIIGVFEGSTIGLEPGKQYTKIIDVNSTINKAWDEYAMTKSQNDWTNSTLNAYLNGEYLNSLSDKNKIAQYNDSYSTWHLLGPFDEATENSATSSDWYLYERLTGYQSTSGGTTHSASASVQSAIALMYPSDYGYAAYGDGCTLDSPLNAYGELTIIDNDAVYIGCGQVDWLMPSNIDRILSPSPCSTNGAMVIDGESGGMVYGYGAQVSGSVRPVLYLDADLKIAEGDGSKDNPYILQ